MRHHTRQIIQALLTRLVIILSSQVRGSMGQIMLLTMLLPFPAWHKMSQIRQILAAVLEAVLELPRRLNLTDGGSRGIMVLIPPSLSFTWRVMQVTLSRLSASSLS